MTGNSEGNRFQVTRANNSESDNLLIKSKCIEEVRLDIENPTNVSKKKLSGMECFRFALCF